MHKICEICKKAAATVHLTEIHNNVKKELHMCEACAEKKGIHMSQSPAMQEALGQAIQEVTTPEELGEVDDACEECGASWGDFRGSGRFGCPACYGAFRHRIDPLLEDIHAARDHHVGKNPRPYAAPYRYDIVECRRQLREAVEQERYEDAALLRDQLAELQGKAPSES